MNKKGFMTIVVIVVILIGMVGGFSMIANSAGEAVKTRQEENLNNSKNICKSIGLEFLSESRQLFGDDYVVCYNKLNNETREILI